MTHVGFEELVAYWSGEPGEPSGAVDEHVMGCEACAALSARVQAVIAAVRGLRPVLTADDLARLRAGGVRVTMNEMTPGETKEAAFTPETDLLIHRLGGLELAGAREVSFEIHVASSGARLTGMERAPTVDDAVLVACYREYAAFPPDTVATVRVRRAADDETTYTYTIMHRF